MACPEFEDLLNHGSDGHAAHCEDCRELLEAWADVDVTLDAALTGVCAPAGLTAAVRARIARELLVREPSLIPEVLDFIGWAAVLAVAAIVIPNFLPIISELWSTI